jgi:tetratricopeptide (TPR) repeat protein
MLTMMLLPQLPDPASAQGGTGSKQDARAIAELERAEQLYAEDKLQEALKLALAQVEPFQKVQDYDKLVDCLFLIGNCYYELGDWAKAESFMINANELGWKMFPDQMGTGALKIIAESQFNQDKVDAALITYRQRVSKLLEQGSNVDQSELAGAHFDVAQALIVLARPAEALSPLSDALQANTAHQAALARPDSGATQDARDANQLDRAEIIYHQAIAYFRQDKLQDCLSRLDAALKEFDAVQASGRLDVRDRLVAVLDDLVVTSEKLGDNTKAAQHRARRDALNQ